MDGAGQNEADVWKRFAAALTFLTRLPLPAPAIRLVEAMDMFPIIGALIGLFCGCIYGGAAAFGATPLLAAILAVTAGLILTGALHEDGLADTADGMGGNTRESRLAIMRDSHIGTYGVLALLAAMAIKVTALASLAPLPGLAALATTGAFSRAAIVWLMWSTPSARSDGLSAMAGRPVWPVTMRTLLIGAAGSAVLLGATAGPGPAIAALVIGAAATWFVRNGAMRSLGGQTGDICGALQVIAENAMLLALALTVR
jgi:adenosylcobinamide-GDP ribazoletransferase